MQEVKRPKQPLIFYYVVMILAILLFNCIIAPYIAGKAISDVDYGLLLGGEPTTHHFTTTEVFQKQGDVWKLIQFTFTALVH